MEINDSTKDILIKSEKSFFSHEDNFESFLLKVKVKLKTEMYFYA